MPAPLKGYLVSPETPRSFPWSDFKICFYFACHSLLLNLSETIIVQGSAQISFPKVTYVKWPYSQGSLSKRSMTWSLWLSFVSQIILWLHAFCLTDPNLSVCSVVRILKSTNLDHLVCFHTKRASLVAQTVKDPPTMRGTWVRSLGWDDPLEEGMATHSSILAWRIPMDRGAWQAPAHGVSELDMTD